MFCTYLKNRIDQLTRELMREFDDWNNTLFYSVPLFPGRRWFLERTNEYFRRREILTTERDELQQVLDAMNRAPGAQV